MMAASLAETRLAVISLVHRHDRTIDDVISRADQIVDWIHRDNGADEARPKKVDPPKAKTSGT